MGLTTGQDSTILQSYSFGSFYQGNRGALVNTARTVYQQYTTRNKGSTVAPTDLVPHLTLALRGMHIFQKICNAKRFVNPSVHPVFARALARYLLDQDWISITH